MFVMRTSIHTAPRLVVTPTLPPNKPPFSTLDRMALTTARRFNQEGLKSREGGMAELNVRVIVLESPATAG